MFEEISNIAISSIILVLSSMYIWKNIDDEIITFNIKNIIIFLICCLFVTINYYYVHDFIRPIIATLLLILYSSYLKKKITNKSITLAMYSQILIIISEFIYLITLVLAVGANSENIVNTYYGSIISNVIISIIAIYISKIKCNKKIYKKIISITDRIKKIHLFLVIIVFAFIASFLTAFFYYKINLAYLMIFNLFVTIIYFIFIYNYFKANNNYLKVYDKYNMTLNSLKEYEDILSRYRISNHENKNQLLTIRGMIKNKKVASYIDEVIENKIKDNEKLMFESMVIPEGGLRGLIYSKMLLMKENNIEFDLCVDKALKTTDLTSISDDLMLSICNIVGVYLDNAIEAVGKLKEKYIIIEIYLDDTLNIAITNNYEGSIDIDNIDKEGYSTKGGNHGYGLSLVKKIIANNKNITNNKCITDNEFTQEIKIKMQKRKNVR